MARSSLKVGRISKACGRCLALMRSNSSLVLTHFLQVPQLAKPFSIPIANPYISGSCNVFYCVGFSSCFDAFCLFNKLLRCCLSASKFCCVTPVWNFSLAACS